MPIPHPDFEELADTCFALRQDAAKPFDGVGFRFATLRYANSPDLLSGKGARRSGGRVNAIGTFPVIYTSTDPLTATAETFQNFTAFGFEEGKLRPRIVVGIEIRLSAMLDLCEAGIRRRLKVTLADMAAAWWPVQEAGREALTQAIGRAAHSAGFEALMLPSVRRKGGKNANIFPEKLLKGSVVRVLAEDELNMHLK